MKRLVFWGTIAMAGTAAYLMYRRGESVFTIGKRVMNNPIGAFTEEIQRAI